MVKGGKLVSSAILITEKGTNLFPASTVKQSSLVDSNTDAYLGEGQGDIMLGEFI